MQLIWIVSVNWQVLGSCISFSWYFKQLLVCRMDDDDDEEEYLDSLFHGDNACHYGLLGKLILRLMAMAFFICLLILLLLLPFLTLVPKDILLHVCSVVSNSLRPSGLSPARFLCPWDFPSKSTKVGAISYSGGSSWPRDRTCISCVFCIGRWILLPLCHLLFGSIQLGLEIGWNYLYAGPEWLCHRPLFYLLCLMPCKLFFLSFIGCGSEHVYSPTTLPVKPQKNQAYLNCEASLMVLK